MIDIQTESGMGPGQLYRLFKGKMNIMVSVVEYSILQQCVILPELYQMATDRDAIDPDDSLINDSAFKILKLNAILRVESMFHPELRDTFNRLNFLLEDKHSELISISIMNNADDAKKLKAMVDIFLCGWGGYEYLPTCKEPYDRCWMASLWRDMLVRYS